MAMVGVGVVALIVGLFMCGQGADEDLLTAAAESQAFAGGGVDTSVGLEASLWVTAPAAGSVVFVDGDSAGVAPLWIDEVAQGTRRVRIVDAGGQTVLDTLVVVQAGELVEVAAPGASFDTAADGVAEALPVAPEPTLPARPQQAQPAPQGELRVTSTPRGARVSLDGRQIGTTPLTVGGLEPGRHALVVERQGYAPEGRTINLQGGGVFEASIDLSPIAVAVRPTPTPTTPVEVAPPARPATGTIEVLVRPWGQIMIDGATHQRETDVVYRTALPPGPHEVTVSHPQLGSSTRTVYILEGGAARIEFDLATGEVND